MSVSRHKAWGWNENLGVNLIISYAMLRKAFRFGINLTAMATIISQSTVAMDFPLTDGRTPDGRFATTCYESGNPVYAPEVCQLSFFRLIANPEDYHERYISIGGFMSLVDGYLLLFPTQSSVEHLVFPESIAFLGAFDDEFLPPAEYEIKPVECVGRFDASFLGGQSPALGALEPPIICQESFRAPAN